MPAIKVPDRGLAPVVREGLKSPRVKNGYLEYDTTSQIEKYWNKLMPAERDEIMERATEQHRDLRDVLSDEMKK